MREVEAVMAGLSYIPALEEAPWCTSERSQTLEAMLTKQKAVNANQFSQLAPGSQLNMSLTGDTSYTVLTLAVPQLVAAVVAV